MHGLVCDELNCGLCKRASLRKDSEMLDQNDGTLRAYVLRMIRECWKHLHILECFIFSENILRTSVNRY
jgi:hypothetical protein